MGDKMFDTVVVYRLDRFARSLMLLLDIIQRLQAYKVDFISTQEMIDTGTPFGNAMV
jgi:DNA invertase Pin-like site-specific DNA recombinase